MFILTFVLKHLDKILNKNDCLLQIFRKILNIQVENVSI